MNQKSLSYLQGYDLTVIMERRWDGSCDWNVRMGGYRIFGKDRQRRCGGGASLSVSDQLECMDLCLGMDEELTEIFGVRTKGRVGTLQWSLLQAS